MLRLLGFVAVRAAVGSRPRERRYVARNMAGGTGKYYAVREGKKTGIYRSWEEVEELVKGYGGAEHKSFATFEEAVEYMARRRRSGSIGGDSGGLTESIAAQLRRCRVTPGSAGGPGSSSGPQNWTEAAV
ncbi:hypothetical protein PIB30_041553 [Stylosanthes scabra]|uniref:Ribonuclease H1 N-terminal domain-containing protein n=1 Tax=Stylosanthes scabra TaxID=79078 RepID=A0ABU6ZDQ3_9FABA|nr:hypothetical protein [Stylosanthes scabra]